MSRVIVQIPCFNEERTLPCVLADIPKTINGVQRLETLVIDDGSSDRTLDVARASGVDHILSHRRNRGLAAAFSSGLQASIQLQADVVVNTDGDHQYPGEYIEQIVAPIVDGTADIVVGNRQPHLDCRNTLIKRLLYRLGKRVVSVLAGQELHDPVCGFRAFSREAVEKLHIVTAYSYTIESLLQGAKKGLVIQHVTIHTNPSTRRSRLMTSIFGFVLRSAATILRVVFAYQCLRVLMLMSLFLGAAGGVPIVRFLWLYATGKGDGHLQSLVFGASLVVISGIVLIAGLIADMVSQNRQLEEAIFEYVRRANRAELVKIWSRVPQDKIG